ncbi:PQQ-like beta-propeller repeat protein [Paenibacillus camerounensis]|uniref:PQQ-like beta-propeller repeat protein n=1 Tax=Paenibacillus camerounensis TaxID=1243663 RepID=UPI0005A8455A|nr:PQQ-like beta-propeller repeat protein [Paenibacillus camerounensis]
MKKILSLLIVCMVIFLPLIHIPAATAEAVNPDTGTEQSLEMLDPITFPVASHSYDYLGTANGLLYFRAPITGNNPRNAKGQLLQQYIVTINAKTNKVQWKLPVYGGFKLGNHAFFDEAGNLYSVIGAGLKQFSNETFVYSVSPKGTIQWQTLYPERISIHNMVNNKLIVYGESMISAVNLKGTIAWTKSFTSKGMQPANFMRGIAANEVLTLKYNTKGQSVSFDVHDWNLKKKSSFPLNATSTVEQALKLNNETYVLNIKISQSTSQLVAVGANGKEKWTKKIDPTTAKVYIADGKLLFANNSGFYVLSGSGEQLLHIPLSPIPVNGITYRLRIDDKYISISPDNGMNLKTALTVLDRKSYKTLYSFACPFDGGEQPDVLFDDFILVNGKFYLIYSNLYQLIPLK